MSLSGELKGILYVGVVLLVLVGIGIAVYMINGLRDDREHLMGLLMENQGKIEQLEDGIVEIKGLAVSKDELEGMLKLLAESSEGIGDLREALKKTDRKISSINNTVAKLEGKVSEGEGSTSTSPAADPKNCPEDKYGYLKEKQHKVIGYDKLPVAEVGFDATVAEPWSYEMYEMKIQTATVVTENDSGSRMALTQVTAQTTGEEVPLDINSSNFMYTKPEPHFMWWAPKGSLLVSLGASSDGVIGGPELSVSLIGYGKSKKELKWRLVDIGMGINLLAPANTKDLLLSFRPVVYCPLAYEDFVSNLCIAPFIGGTFNPEEAVLSGGLSVGAVL